MRNAPLRRLAPALTVVACLLAAPAAMGATASVDAAQDRLALTASNGERNLVTVTGSGSSRSVKNGASVLRGQLKLADKPVVTGTGANKATVLAQIPLLPLPNSGG